MKPRVTVVLPAYNAAAYLQEAIASIRAQSEARIEILTINDGSTDTTQHILTQFDDARLRRIDHEQNLGLVAALNRGIDEASADYVAIMHADDIARPERLRMQADFLDAHPQVVAVGSRIQQFPGALPVPMHYRGHSHIVAESVFNSPLAHPSVMLRRQTLIQHDLRYRAETFPLEDWDLWTRLHRIGKLANIPSVLLDYRRHPASLTDSLNVAAFAGRVSDILDSIHRAHLEPLGLSDFDRDAHRSLAFHNSFDKQRMLDWLDRLREANHRTRFYAEPAFTEILAVRRQRIRQPSLAWAWPTIRGIVRRRFTERQR